MIEPECDLIEEVLRLRGLDAVPPVSLPRAAPVPPATLTPRQAAHGAGPPHAGGARPRGMRHLQLHGRRRRGAVRRGAGQLRLTNPIAADLDQLRPTPVATLALAAQAQRRARLPRRGAVRSRPGVRRDAPDGQRADRRRPARRRHAAQLAGPIARRSTRWTPRPICWAVLAALGVPMEALTVTADAPGFYHPGRSGTRAPGAQNRARHASASCIRACSPRSDLPGPVVAFELFLDAVPEPKRRRKSPPGPAAVPAGAARLRLPGGRAP